MKVTPIICAVSMIVYLILCYKGIDMYFEQKKEATPNDKFQMKCSFFVGWLISTVVVVTTFS